MTHTFRLSHRPNRAHDIQWREWGSTAFEESATTGRPIFLNLSAVWCHWCHLMDETTFSDPAVIRLLNDDLIAIRVDADQYPHVQDRYIAGGWPTNAFLTSTGEVLWAGTFTESEDLQNTALGVIAAWRSRREEFETEIERRHRALGSTRTRQTSAGLVRREASDDVFAATRESFDARNGGFGTEPKFPAGESIELLYARALRSDPDSVLMADRTLDGMLAGDLLDREDGGFFRYATSADWTAARYEKLLEINALQLEAYALGACVRGRPDWSEIAGQIVAWVDRRLALTNGLWAGSQYADEHYFSQSRAVRATLTAPPIDDTVYTNWNAQWIAALAFAGGRLGRAEWITRAANALEALTIAMGAPGGLMYHFRQHDGRHAIDGLLSDTLEVARAELILFQATGETVWLQRARANAQLMEKNFWADDGGFYDRTRAHEEIGALRYRERPFELNSRVARFLLDLSWITGERGFRALAERTLAVLSPQAARFGAAGAVFALAVDEFFETPPFVALVGSADATAEFRRNALALPVPGLRTWRLETGGRIGTQSFPASPAPAAYVCGRHGCAAVHDGNILASAISQLL
jgi:uncharacterized protein YyaL (SSP411 family)